MLCDAEQVEIAMRTAGHRAQKKVSKKCHDLMARAKNKCLDSLPVTMSRIAFL